MKLIALAIILSVGSLFAVDAVTNYYGLLKVNSSDSRTIVAIPWIDASTTNGEIKVADVVRTADLAEGDTIHYYNGSAFESWKLNSETQWVAAVQVGISGSSQPGISPEKKALERGNALILMRRTNASKPLYLWGQVASSTATTEIKAGASNLIAPPVINDAGTVNLNTGATWSNVNTGDRISIQTSSQRIDCQYKDSKWQEYGVTGVKKYTIGDEEVEYPVLGWKDASTIPLGTGFWYNADAGSTVSVTWNNVPFVPTAND